MMVKSIEALQNEWKYGRGIVLSFLEEITDSDLHKKFPRENYNTILEQCNELYEIQQDYVEAIETKTMRFAGRNLHTDSAEQLASKMKELDIKLDSHLQTLSGNEEISWFGKKKNIHQHLCAMIGHEMMHIGQMVAFCYAVNITIPEYIVHELALDG